MNNGDRMKEAGQDLVFVANSTAVSLNVPFIDRFPFVAEIDLERWDFFITIACVWVALSNLHYIDICTNEEAEIRDVVMNALKEQYPDGEGAIYDCTKFMERSLSGDEEIQPDDVLGCWIVWNLYGRKELDEDEEKLIRILGGLAFKTFGSWWEG